MIEIVQHGNTSKRTICPKCNCDFRYFKVDVKWADLITEIIGCVRCPEYGQQIVVEREENVR